jgi:hypothetical protein
VAQGEPPGFEPTTGAEASSIRGPGLSHLTVVFDMVAVRAENDALGDFRSNGFNRVAQVDHVSDIEVFFLIIAVVELERSVIVEPATNTRQGVLVGIDPLPEPTAAGALGRDLARTAHLAAIDALPDPPTDPELGCWPWLPANSAYHHISCGRRRLGERVRKRESRRFVLPQLRRGLDPTLGADNVVTRGPGFRPGLGQLTVFPALRPSAGVFDVVAVRAENDALGDLALNRLARGAAPDDVADVEIFVLPVGVVELKCPVVSEITLRAAKSLFVASQPSPQVGSALVGIRPLAAPTPQPTIGLTIDHPANLKRLFGLLGVAVLANRHGSSPAERLYKTEPSPVLSG